MIFKPDLQKVIVKLLGINAYTQIWCQLIPQKTTRLIKGGVSDILTYH